MENTFTITGKLSFIKYATEGFQACTFLISENNEEAKLKAGDILPLTSTITLDMGLSYDLKVERHEHYKYGTTYKVININEVKLNDKENIIKYLAENVPGVGRVAAAKIFDHFGDDLIEKIAHEPDLINEVDLSEIQKIQLLDYFNNQIDFITQKVINWCFHEKIDPQNHFKGISFQQLARSDEAFLFENFISNPFNAIFKLINENINTALSDNLKIDTFSKQFYPFNFEFYKTLYKVNNQDNITEIAFFDFVCWLYKTIWSDTYVTNEQINEYLIKKYDSSVLDGVWTKIYSCRHLWFGDEILTFSTLYRKEHSIYETLEKIHKTNSYLEAKKKPDFDLVEALSTDKLNDLQLDIVYSAFNHPITLVNGRPGTGKTTTIKEIVNIIEAIDYDNQEKTTWPILLAPTGKAARRIEEVTKIRAYTMHRFFAEVILLEDRKELDDKLVIIDEASMISYDSFLFTLSWIKKHNCKLMLVGDTFQLPPIGQGNLFQDLWETSPYNKVELHKTYRQSHDSKMYEVLEAIRNENFSFDLIDGATDIHFTQISDTKALEFILKRFKDKVYSFENSIILSPRRNGSFLSATKNINKYFQENYNQCIEYLYETAFTKFKPFDEVMYIENKYNRFVQEIEVEGVANKYQQYSFFNGDEGYIMPCELGAIGKILTVKNKLDGLENTFDLNKDKVYNYLELGYAKTIHKAQGSEYDNVFLLIYPEQGFGLLEPKLIYTAISRAKKNIFICGDKATFLESLSHARIKSKNNLISKFYENKK